MEILKERNGVALCKVGLWFYVVGIDRARGQVTSIVHGDMPAHGGAWFGPLTSGGVRYVARGRTLQRAKDAFYRVSGTDDKP